MSEIAPWVAKRYEDTLRSIAAASQDEAVRQMAEEALLPGVSYTQRHAYKPHRKHPWFCDVCGYPEHESLQHA